MVQLFGNDLAAATERAERGVRCGAAGEALGQLRLVQADAVSWGGGSGNAEAVTRGREAMAALAPASPAWFSAAGQVALAHGRLGESDRLLETAKEMLAHLERGEVSQPAVIAAAFAADQLLYYGHYDAADELLATIEARAGALVARLPAVRGRVSATRATRALLRRSGGALRAARDGRALLRRGRRSAPRVHGAGEDRVRNIWSSARTRRPRRT